jgi:hypothetical protein
LIGKEGAVVKNQAEIAIECAIKESGCLGEALAIFAFVTGKNITAILYGTI